MIPALPEPLAALEGVLGAAAELVAWLVALLVVAFLYIRLVKLEEAIVQQVPTKVVVGLAVLLVLLVFGVIPLP
ncbi:hypothetical protein [Halosimplex halobium]|uniref:hypothetical protein n=1 Tax=Halosimplex halobium TaxID=3396618 RepID=UPI003F555143